MRSTKAEQVCNEPSWLVLQRAFNPVGIKAIAHELRLSYSTVAKWQEDPTDCSGSGSRNPLDRIDAMREALVQQDHEREALAPLRWLAQRAGHRLVKDSDLPLSNDGLLREVLALAAESGDVHRAFENAIRDEKIDTKERAQLIKELREAQEQAARLELILCSEPFEP